MDYTKLRATFVHDLAARNLSLLLSPAWQTKGALRFAIHTHMLAQGFQKQLAVRQTGVPHPETPAVGVLP